MGSLEVAYKWTWSNAEERSFAEVWRGEGENDMTRMSLTCGKESACILFIGGFQDCK